MQFFPQVIEILSMNLSWTISWGYFTDGVAMNDYGSIRKHFEAYLYIFKNQLYIGKFLINFFRSYGYYKIPCGPAKAISLMAVVVQWLACLPVTQKIGVRFYLERESSATSG